jgi:hypothetical protein
MSVMQERKTNVRFLRDTDEGCAMSFNKQKILVERVSPKATSLEAAFVDRTEFRVVGVAINQALPQSWVQLYSQ